MQVYQLVYASGATFPFTDERLAALLAVARARNARLGVTGMLLFHEGSFLQVLEGEEAVVKRLYRMIQKDDRHADLVVLMTRDIPERQFGEWSMGFVPDCEQAVRELPGFNDFFAGGMDFQRLNGDASRTRALVEGFRAGRWRRAID